MKTVKILFCFFPGFFLLLLSPQLNAQSYFFRNYSVEDGLPFINVSAIFQDSRGNLWSGGYGGLSRFDGTSFTNYSPRDGLLNHYVSCITEDDQKNLWVGTISGINKFDGKIFEGYTTRHGLISNNITACVKDQKGDIWFGTDKGVSKLTGGSFINYTEKDGLAGASVNCLFCDHAGNIWIGTALGVSCFDGKLFHNYTIADGMPSSAINSIAEDKAHTLWFATDGGLCSFSGGKFSSYANRPGIAGNKVSALIIDHRNILWLATPKGMVRFENNSFIDFPIRRDQNSNIINCFFEDFEKNLWIGTYAGLFKYRGNPFVTYGIDDGLTDNFIFGILRDSRNTLWVGSQGGGLYRYRNGRFDQFSDLQGLHAKKINAIYEISPGKLWLATEKGLITYDGKSFTQGTDTSGIFTTNLNLFFKDSKNNIWIGGNKKIFKYDGKKFTGYTFKCRAENFETWAFAEDDSGNLWIGTYLGGLIKFDGTTFTECSRETGMNSDSFLAALKDRQGNIYFATLDGIYMFNPSHPTAPVAKFGKEDGMSSELVYSLTFGKNESEIWAGTNQGLNHIAISEFKKSGRKAIIPFGKQEGFSGVECNSGNFVEKDGSIWFGTVNGLIHYDPREYIENTSESKISITGYRLFYTDTVLAENIHLSYYLNNITFNYSGICLTNPSKVQYQHWLQGFEKDWSPPTKDRFATYSNLPPGNYTFNVISSNNEGVWNKQPATFHFVIERPFWKTWWFIGLTAMVIVLGLIFSIRFRIRQIKYRETQKTELNKKIANIESQALRAQMNPHFIFNTLSSIQHYISNNNTDAALKYLSKFAKLMRKIMDNSKQQMIPVSEELDALHLYLELEIMRFDQKFAYKIAVDPEIDQNYDRIPSMLIQPYVENAIIHGLLPKDQPGKIDIFLQKRENTILCTIEDNGIGRERSREFKKNRVQQHKSMGMSITKERLEILNSSLNSNLNAEILDLYEDGKPSGTRVMLIIPLEINED